MRRPGFEEFGWWGRDEVANEFVDRTRACVAPYSETLSLANRRDKGKVVL
jgi:hypothetical protein